MKINVHKRRNRYFSRTFLIFEVKFFVDYLRLNAYFCYAFNEFCFIGRIYE